MIAPEFACAYQWRSNYSAPRFNSTFRVSCFYRWATMSTLLARLSDTGVPRVASWCTQVLATACSRGRSTYLLIRPAARLPPGEPGHRCPELLRRSAEADAAAEGDTQPIQEIHGVFSYSIYRVRDRGTFHQTRMFSHDEI